MLTVAFFRNLNQGQRNSPSSAQLIAAFGLVGVPDAVPFQNNGTVLFDAPDPVACTRAVVERLAATSPWSDVALVRNAEWLIAFMAGLRIDASTFRRTELSLFDESSSPSDKLPLTGKGCTVVSGGPGFAVTRNDRDRESNATPTLERALGVAVTSRGLPTLSRLVERLAR